MAWNSYHDWLMTEAIALMSEPGWNEQNEDGTYKYPDLMSRLEAIRGELSTAAQGMGDLPKLDPATGAMVRDQSGNIVYESWDDKMGNLLSQFEQARVQGEQFTDQQINALLGGTGGRWDQYNPATGLGVMSYPQLAAAVQSQYVNPAGTTLSSMYSGAITPQQAQQRWQQAWGDPAQQGTLANQYEAARSRTMGYLDNAGQQAAKDITSAFGQQRAATQQDLAQRGLGNTTVVNSALSGLTTQEAAEQRRLQESLGQLKAGYESALSGQANQAALGMATGGLGAYGDFYGQQNALGSQYANYLSGAGQLMGGLWGQAPAAVAGITSAYPSLADVYNLASQAGVGSTGIFALPGFQPGMVFGASTGAAGSGG